MKSIVSLLILLALLLVSSQAERTGLSSLARVFPQPPQQFLMDIYTRPNRKGMLQHIRLDQESVAVRPCWNLTSRYVGSVGVNDPFVKVTFYRATDCTGFPLKTVHNSETLLESKRYSSIIKAKSVSITRTRPILLRNPDIFSKDY